MRRSSIGLWLVGVIVANGVLPTYADNTRAITAAVRAASVAPVDSRARAGALVTVERVAAPRRPTRPVDLFSRPELFPSAPSISMRRIFDPTPSTPIDPTIASAPIGWTMDGVTAPTFADEQMTIRMRTVPTSGGAGGDYMSWPLLDLDDVFDTDIDGSPEDTSWKCAQVPNGTSNGETWDVSGQAATFDLLNAGQIYMVNRNQKIGKIQLPTMTHNTVGSSCPVSTNVSPGIITAMDDSNPNDFTIDGKPFTSQTPSIYGLTATTTKLLGSWGHYFDTGNRQVLSHFSRPLDLSDTTNELCCDAVWNGSSRASQLANPPYGIPYSSGISTGIGNVAPNFYKNFPGFTAGYTFRVPAGYQAHLGGYTMASGNASQSIVERSSFGPAFGLYDPDLIVGGTSTAANPHPWVPLAFYDQDHKTFGGWADPNPAYPCPGGFDPPNPCGDTIGQDNLDVVMPNGLSGLYDYVTEVRGCAIIDLTRSLFCIGKKGLVDKTWECYGTGDADIADHYTEDPSTPGFFLCYDPTGNSKGNHMWPYMYFVWAYDMAEVIEVFNGTREPWNLIPYAASPFELPYMGVSASTKLYRPGGVDFNPSTREFMFVQFNMIGLGPKPIINVKVIP